MSTKQINGRFQQKHDIEAHWLLATNFSPLEGEIIIYDPDETHSTPRFKIGDGVTNVNNLPFTVNVEVGAGKNSIQQTPEADTWPEGYDGNQFITESTDITKGENNSVVIGAIGNFSTSLGGKSQAKGKRSVAEGTTTVALGGYSHAEGNGTFAAAANSHTEGAFSTAFGIGSHAEGHGTVTRGEAAHAEGYETEANGVGAHSEGVRSKAIGNNSHAEGTDTQAIGDHSHSEGIGTVANAYSQHVQGQFNVVDEIGQFAHIVGGGNSDTERKNIHTLDWGGNAVYSGIVTSEGFESIYIDTNTIHSAGGIATDGHLSADSIESKKHINASGLTSTNSLSVSEDATIGSLHVNEQITTGGNIEAQSGYIRTNKVYTNKIDVTGTFTAVDGLYTEGDVHLNSNVYVGGEKTEDNKVVTKSELTDEVNMLLDGSSAFNKITTDNITSFVDGFAYSQIIMDPGDVSIYPTTGAGFEYVFDVNSFHVNNGAYASLGTQINPWNTIYAKNINLITEDNASVAVATKNDTEALGQELATKSNKLIAGNNITITPNEDGTETVAFYETLEEKNWTNLGTVNITEDGVSMILPDFPENTYKEFYMRGSYKMVRADGSTGTVYVTVVNPKNGYSVSRINTTGSTIKYYLMIKGWLSPDGMPMFNVYSGTSQYAGITQHTNIAPNGFSDIGYEYLPKFGIKLVANPASVSAFFVPNESSFTLWGR